MRQVELSDAEGGEHGESLGLILAASGAATIVLAALATLLWRRDPARIVTRAHARVTTMGV